MSVLLYGYRVWKNNQFLTDRSLMLVFLFWGLGMLFIGFGLLAELVVRVYHESQNKPIYYVRETLNL
jgi:hypothetical protein